MKYRVKFRCYWYNTGGGDNHHYDNHEDFDSIEDAEIYKNRINMQKQIFNDNSDGWVKRNEEWKNSSNYIEIENGFIASDAKIIGFYPEREINL